MRIVEQLAGGGRARASEEDSRTGVHMEHILKLCEATIQVVACKSFLWATLS